MDVVLHLAQSFAQFRDVVAVRQIMRRGIPCLVITCHHDDKGKVIGKGGEHIEMMRTAAKQTYQHFGGGQIDVVIFSKTTTNTDGIRRPFAVIQPGAEPPVVEYRKRVRLVRPYTN
ncbi:KH domain-containing protein [Candidatus Parcubacteria bacterium]|nr:KH domain-containing protein [Patescibacteria group bacterium]MCG2687665.1 KH domain-containing protein [Candidatus Parcubacteria bacterium]